MTRSNVRRRIASLSAGSGALAGLVAVLLVAVSQLGNLEARAANLAHAPTEGKPTPTVTSTQTPTPSASSTPTAPAEPSLTVWVSPTGSDSAAGTDPEHPFRTLDGASDWLCQGDPCRPRGVPVVVRVAQKRFSLADPHPVRVTPGRHREVKRVGMTWRYLDPKAPVVIQPWNYTQGGTERQVMATGGFPTFDGEFAVHTGLSVMPDASVKGPIGRLSLKYLRWRHLTSTGIELHGGLTQEVRSDGKPYYKPTAVTLTDVRIEGCRFERIGNYWNPAEDEGWGAIMMTNAPNAQIVNNRFVDLLNTKASYTHMHAVYVAHGSHQAVIRENYFGNITGTAIRQRDASNRMLVEGNIFERAGSYAYVDDYYCRPLRPSRECAIKEYPSYGGVLRDNQLLSLYGYFTPNELGPRDVACLDNPLNWCTRGRLRVENSPG